MVVAEAVEFGDLAKDINLCPGHRFALFVQHEAADSETLGEVQRNGIREITEAGYGGGHSLGDDDTDVGSVEVEVVDIDHPIFSDVVH